MKPLKSIPRRDRPREKLVNKGPVALTDQELVAAILGRGVKGVGIREISQKVVHILQEKKQEVILSDLTSIDGVGIAKAAQVLSAIELSRRILVNDKKRVNTAQDVLPLVEFIRNKKQEYFLCISLNGANEVISTRVITIGLLNKNQVHPREVFAEVIKERAASVIFVHNHPSGELEPSKDDIMVHQRLKEAGKLLGIEVLDHLIGLHPWKWTPS